MSVKRRIKRAISRVIVSIVNATRRFPPEIRNGFDRLFQRPLEAGTQFFINLLRKREALGIAEERKLPNEDEVTAGVVAAMSSFTRRQYEGRYAERAGNTKTYGVARGEFTVLDDLPDDLRQGLFRDASRYPAWVRFGGPGPLVTPDIENNGILSIGIKVMGVAGEKLLDDETATQDFTGISAPTFTTPDVVENLKLQREIGEGTPIFYFINPFDSHFLDMVMQGLYSKSHANPLELQYFSCVPYLYGEGRAIKYTIKPRIEGRSKVPRPPGDDYLRDAMVKSLAAGEMVFDFMVQFQTDAHRMPIENAAVAWPERLSPFRKVATLRLPPQAFDSMAQLKFAGNLAYNPWHAIAEHRPLGNQNRARLRIYQTLSRLRQEMNDQPHIEPTGDEVFDD